MSHINHESYKLWVIDNDKRFLIKFSHAVNQKSSIIHNSIISLDIPAGRCFIPCCWFHSSATFYIWPKIEIINCGIQIRQEFVSIDAFSFGWGFIGKTSADTTVVQADLLNAIPIWINSFPILISKESIWISSTFCICLGTRILTVIPDTSKLVSFLKNEKIHTGHFQDASHSNAGKSTADNENAIFRFLFICQLWRRINSKKSLY